IVFENLKITNMQKKHCRCGLESVHHDHREQSGRGWFSCDPGEPQEYITAVFQVCGMIVKKTFSDRVHSCPQCGLAMDRDQNAGV
ncbi:MAG: zinc ribbon domain-containing protein, partial [Candidatus Methanoculleus thermohydrogenotrophicum]